jgi:hypothetical protein
MSHFHSPKNKNIFHEIKKKKKDLHFLIKIYLVEGILIILDHERDMQTID